MRQDLTQIAIILDRSGSMGIVREATIESFNGFIDGQKKDPNDVNLLFVQFDSEGPHDIVFEGNLKNFTGLTSDTYAPRASTPLHDAMGWTIEELGRRLSALSENERPEKVLVVILTDGYENSSTDYTREKVADIIKQQTDVYKWQFIFLAANQDAVLTAKTYNIGARSALTYAATSTGMRSGVGAMNSVVDCWKYSSSKIKFSDEDRKKAQQ